MGPEEVLESAKAQWASATTAAESLALEEEAAKPIEGLKIGSKNWGGP